MNKKYFIIGDTPELTKEDNDIIEQEKVNKRNQLQSQTEELNNKIKNQSVNLKTVEGKVIIAIDVEAKNWHTFEGGLKIRRERQFNELNKRVTEPVNAIVIDAKNIPSGAEVLVHHNSAQDTNKIFGVSELSGEESATDIKYYSIHEDKCYAWRVGEQEWQPTETFDFALRLFKPHTGIIEGVEPTLIPDTLYVTTGQLKGTVVKTVKSSDYCIVFQENTGRERQIIRFRPFGDEKNQREPEAIAIMHDLTEQINKGLLLVGIEPSDAKTIDKTAFAD